MNLRFLNNVVHNGIIFKGQQIKDNRVVHTGMVVDLETDTRGLKDVADSLIDRGLAQETTDPATHTSVLVNQAQEAVAVTSSNGASTPVADQIKQREALQAANQPENKLAEPALPQQPATVPQAPAAPARPVQNDIQTGQPSADEVAAAANAA